jgi:hypothetical protein
MLGGGLCPFYTKKEELSMGEVVKTVTISLEKYNYLLERDEFLNCLEACRVDNWDGFGDAHGMMEHDE